MPTFNEKCPCCGTDCLVTIEGEMLDARKRYTPVPAKIDAATASLQEMERAVTKKKNEMRVMIYNLNRAIETLERL